MAKKSHKGEPILEEKSATEESPRDVAADPDLETAGVHSDPTPSDQPQPTSISRGDHQPTSGDTILEAIPQSCPNCGSNGAGVVQVLADDQFQCTRCRHRWGSEADDAPFRRYGRAGR